MIDGFVGAYIYEIVKKYVYVSIVHAEMEGSVVKKNIKKISLLKAIVLCLLFAMILSVKNEKSYGKSLKKRDVKSLNRIINVMRERGADVSTNIYNRSQYKWNKKTGRLQSIYWSKKKLKGEISFNKLDGLKVVDISKNRIEKLHISKLNNLVDLDCANNKLAKLYIKKNSKLKFLDCSNNKITSLNVLNNKRLIDLCCSNNRLTKLKVDKSMRDLFEIDCDGNKIESMHIESLEMLEVLDCANNHMKKLVIKDQGDIEVYCEYNKLKSLDFYDVSVRVIMCHHNKLKSLNEECYLAEFINCSYNNIKELKGRFHNAKELYCNDNELTKLEFTEPDIVIRKIYCQNNKLSSIDLSNIRSVRRVVCDKDVEVISESEKLKVVRK